MPQREEPPRRVHLRPARAGLKVSVPSRIRGPRAGRHLAPDGEIVVLDSYWRRRLRAGDVEQIQPGRALLEDDAPAGPPKKKKSTT